jgi:ATP-dependent protease ClpP protease subunit
MAGKKDKNFFFKRMKDNTNLDWFLTPPECKALGLIDHVAVPNLISVGNDADSKK